MSNVGLVLSGGMAKGAYQIGALQAISEMFKPSDIGYISAASVGAVNAYAFATQGLDKCVKLYNSVNNKNNRKLITTLLKSCFLQEAIKTILSDKQIENPFYVPLVNIKRRSLLYAELSQVLPENIEPYIRASVSMPVFNSGVYINGEHYFDGAMVDNIPIQPILKYNLDYVICIYFDDYNYTFESRYFDNKVLKINFTENKIISDSLCISGDSIKYMIDEGYKKTRKILKFAFENGINDTNALYGKIETLNTLNPSRTLPRITGDVIVGNMNKIAKKFMKRIDGGTLK